MKQRTASQIREHYEIEKEIARKLRESTGEERKNLYTASYDELLQKVTHHPCLTNKNSEVEKRRRVEKETRNLQPFLKKDSVFLEVGPGDCAISCKVAETVKKVYAIDVSREITKNLDAPPNFELILSDGSTINVAAESVDVAYSNQLMEHLHPEDASEQLRNIFRALKPGGVYFCSTPNRLTGPHDISRDFDAVATGLHLKEYTVTDLDKLFRETGFSKTKVYLRFGEKRFFLPVGIFKMAEGFLDLLPNFLRKMVTFNRPVRYVLGIKLIGTK
jgi:2-polyprenyl-3-methyl-5-hydroxy-6-metoxy-1,4-benzoquinol methylase